MLNLKTEWTGGPKSTNGAYGFYPVESEDVLIDGCVAMEHQMQVYMLANQKHNC